MIGGYFISIVHFVHCRCLFTLSNNFYTIKKNYTNPNIFSKLNQTIIIFYKPIKYNQIDLIKNTENRNERNFLPSKRKTTRNSSPDCSGNPVIACVHFQRIASFLAMTDCSGKRVTIFKKAKTVLLLIFKIFNKLLSAKADRLFLAMTSCSKRGE